MDPSDVSRKSLQCPNCGANVANDSVCCAYCHSVLSVTACPSCFGAVFTGMKFCPDCGAAVERHEAASDHQLACPRCNKILAPVDIAGARIFECHDCGGFWLNNSSFQKICADQEQQEKVLIYPSPANNTELDSKLKPQSKRFYVPCPECRELMNQKNFAGCSGTIIDVCKPHGIWFDRQELQRIINFIRDGGLHKARENELAKIKAEQNRLQELQYDQKLEPASLRDDDDALIDVVFSICKKIFK